MQEISVTRVYSVGLPPHKKTDSSDNTNLGWLFHPVVATKNTEKVVETITSYDG